jgi:hypothetical protein
MEDGIAFWPTCVIYEHIGCLYNPFAKNEDVWLVMEESIPPFSRWPSFLCSLYDYKERLETNAFQVHIQLMLNVRPFGWSYENPFVLTFLLSFFLSFFLLFLSFFLSFFLS